MNRKIYFDQQEKELIDSIENEEWRESGDVTTIKKQFKEALHKTLKEKRSISIRLPEADIHEIKKKSIQAGIPYQNLIQSLVHKFAIGEIKLGL